MPFGGTSSVHFFVWISRALWVFLLYGLLIVCGHWVDDFPVIELEVNSAAAELFLNRFFALLGWPIRAPDSFARVFDPLGVKMDLGQIVDGMIRVENKASRMEELEVEITEIVRTGAVSPAVARVIR